MAPAGFTFRMQPFRLEELAEEEEEDREVFPA